MFYAAMGEIARALDLLEPEARSGGPTIGLWNRGPWLDLIRRDRRYLAVLRPYDVPADPLELPRRAVALPNLGRRRYANSPTGRRNFTTYPSGSLIVNAVPYGHFRNGFSIVAFAFRARA
jgi:hypothetical protein